MWPNLQKTADLVTFAEEVINGKNSFFVQWQIEVLLPSEMTLLLFYIKIDERMNK